MLPGSSLKGCLRTAWLARCAKDRALSERDLGRGKSSQRHDLLVKQAFAMNEKETAMDPFRDVTLTDSRLPDSATRVDLVSGWKYDGSRKTYAANPSGKIQDLRERMRSVTDGGEPPLVPVRIGLRSGNVRSRRSKAARSDAQPRQSPESIYQLLSALEEHHEPLWQREIDKFFSGTEHRLEEALDLFSGMSRGGERPAAALLRIGWATHAEAKSVAGFRSIHRPQFRGTRDEYAREGSARHVVDLLGGPSPFGWALVVMAADWQARKDSIAWLSAEPSVKRRSGVRSGSGPGSLRSPQLKYRKDETVRLADGSFATLLEDVRDGQSEVQVLIDGDKEPVRVLEIDGPA